MDGEGVGVSDISGESDVVRSGIGGGAGVSGKL